MKKSILFFLAIVCIAKVTAAVDWNYADSIVKTIVEPQFPNRTYKITDYKAKSTPDFDNSKIINRLINQCSKRGGGTVIIPAGTFHTGPITLKSNVNLHLEEGATLKFSNNPNDYVPFVKTRWEGMDVINYRPLIYANGAENIAVTGKGVLDGQADDETWWWMKGRTRFGWDESMPSQYDRGRPKLYEMMANEVPIKDRKLTKDDLLRPQFVSPINSKNVLIEGVTIIDAPFWVIHPIFCENVIVRDVTIRSHGPNNDGCNPESSKNVLIEGCTFDTGDDCIAIKSGRNEDGRREIIPSENIIIRNCTMKDGHGGVVLGSEISGGARNIFVENCYMNSPQLDRVVRIKSNTVRGGYMENLFVRNVEVGECKREVFLIEFDYEPQDGEGDFLPVVKNVHVENLKSNKGRYGILIKGVPNRIQISDIKFVNCEFNNVQIPMEVRGVENFQFINSSMTVEKAK